MYHVKLEVPEKNMSWHYGLGISLLNKGIGSSLNKITGKIQNNISR